MYPFDPIMVLMCALMFAPLWGRLFWLLDDRTDLFQAAGAGLVFGLFTTMFCMTYVLWGNEGVWYVFIHGTKG